MKIVATLALLALPPGDLLPLKDGAQWTYLVQEQTAEQAASSREVVAEVGAARAIGDGEWTEIRNFLGYAACYVRATDAAIEMKAEATETAPVLAIWKASGETWAGTVGRDELKFASQGKAEVEVGDERLRADHVSFTVAAPEKHAGHAATKGDLWFVAGRGLVRAQVTKDLDCHSAATTVYVLKR